MESNSLKFLLPLIALFLITPTGIFSLRSPANPTSDVSPSKFQIECTMCSACDNPCGQYLSPPPPPPSPTYYPPPPPPTADCPPPPSTYYYSSPPPPSTYYYSSPPPPTQSTYYYSSPPPPRGYYQSPPYNNYPAPPPPNPIVPYFPFYFHTPPPGSAGSIHLPSSFSSFTFIITVFTLLFSLF